MKAISIPIHKHTPVRRRPSRYCVSLYYNAAHVKLQGFSIINGESNTVVHTGTTKVKDKRYLVTNEAYLITKDAMYREAKAWEILGKKINKRPSIFSKFRRKK